MSKGASLMRIFDGLRPHSRWRREVDAYVDGELAPGGLVALERHLAGCTTCAGEVAARRALKQTTAALPLASAPRSFRLTADALGARPRSVSASRARPAVLRFSQVGAAAAGLALLATLTIDYRSDDSGPVATQAPAAGALASESGATSKSAPVAQATAAAPAAAPPVRDTGPAEVPGVAPSPGGGARAAAEEDSNSGPGRWLRPLEVALAGLFAVSLAVALTLASRQRRTPS